MLTIATANENGCVSSAGQSPYRTEVEITLNGSSTLRRVLNVQRSFVGQIQISVTARTRKAAPGRFNNLAFTLLTKNEAVQEICLHQSAPDRWSLCVGRRMSIALAAGEAEKLIEAFDFRVTRTEAQS